MDNNNVNNNNNKQWFGGNLNPMNWWTQNTSGTTDDQPTIKNKDNKAREINSEEGKKTSADQTELRLGLKLNQQPPVQERKAEVVVEEKVEEVVVQKVLPSQLKSIEIKEENKTHTLPSKKEEEIIDAKEEKKEVKTKTKTKTKTKAKAKENTEAKAKTTTTIVASVGEVASSLLSKEELDSLNFEQMKTNATYHGNCYRAQKENQVYRELDLTERNLMEKFAFTCFTKDKFPQEALTFLTEIDNFALLVQYVHRNSFTVLDKEGVEFIADIQEIISNKNKKLKENHDKELKNKPWLSQEDRSRLEKELKESYEAKKLNFNKNVQEVLKELFVSHVTGKKLHI